MDSSSSEADRSELPESRKPQFSLRMAFLLTLVVAVTAATWGGLTRQGPDRLLFLFFAAAAPFAVLVGVGILHEFLRWRRKR